MTIVNILQALPSAEKPIARALHKGKDFKLLAIGLKKGLSLKEHKASIPSRLIILEGEVIYRQGDISRTLRKYEEYDIPVGEIHALEAIEDSLCLLSQGN